MVRSTVLDNGIRVVTEHVSGFNSCSIGFWFEAGSRFESEEQAGLSHFIEHLLFKGTRKRTAFDIAAAMDGVGGQLNAFTEKERACYYARVMYQHLPLAVDVLSDMIKNSLFEATELEREKAVILEELKMVEDSPDDLCMHLFARSLWGPHSLGRPIIGYRQQIADFNREQVVDYYRRRYLAENTTVVAAGRVDHDEFVGLVRKHTQDFPRGRLERRMSQARPASRTTVFARESEQTYLAYGGAGLAADDPRRYAALMLDSILGGTMSSRLFQEVREKRGLAYAVGTFQNGYLDTGVLGVYAGTSAEKAEEVLAVVRGVLEEVRAGGITEAELQRARELIKGNMGLALESTSGRMLRLARCIYYQDRQIPVEEVWQILDRISCDEIHELARELLDPSGFALTAVGPLQELDRHAARALTPEAFQPLTVSL